MGVMGNLAITRSVCRVWSDLVSTNGERAADRRLRPPHDDGGVVDPLRCGPQAVVRSVGQALSLDSSWVPSGWPVPMEVSRSKAVSSMGLDLMPNPWESRPLYRDLCEGYPGGRPSLRAQAPERPLMGILWQYVTHLSWMVDGAT